MTGVDISPQMLDLARQEEARAPLGIRYELESSAELRSFADHQLRCGGLDYGADGYAGFSGRRARAASA